MWINKFTQLGCTQSSIATLKAAGGWQQRTFSNGRLFQSYGGWEKAR